MQELVLNGEDQAKKHRGRPKGSLNKKTLKKLKAQEPIPDKPTGPGRPRGSLNKKTLEKILNKEILDPRLYPKIKYKHPGRPKETRTYLRDKKFRESLLNPKEEKTKAKKKLSEADRLEICRSYAVDWCYRNNAELYKYSESFFVFRYKNDPTRRRYQLGYEYGDYPMIWLPFTNNLAKVEM